MHKKMRCMQSCECECRVFEPTFVSLCLFVCKSVSVCVNVCVRERVSGDAPSKSSPRQGVIHDFITQALHKALSNTPPFLSTPLCFFPMLPFLFSCLSCSFLHTAFSLPSLLFYNSPLLNALTTFFFLSSVDLLHFCPYLLLVFFGFISILHLFFFLLLSTPVSKCFFWSCFFCNLSSLLSSLCVK